MLRYSNATDKNTENNEEYGAQSQKFIAARTLQIQQHRYVIKLITTNSEMCCPLLLERFFQFFDAILQPNNMRHFRELIPEECK